MLSAALALGEAAARAFTSSPGAIRFFIFCGSVAPEVVSLCRLVLQQAEVGIM